MLFISFNRERDDLMNTLTGQKAVLAEVRQREFEAYNQVKNSCHMVEQAQLEKAEVCHAEILKFVEIHCNFHRKDPKALRSRKTKMMQKVYGSLVSETNKICIQRFQFVSYAQ